MDTESKSEAWKEDWQRLVDAVGTDFGAEIVWEGADEIDHSSLRRYLEPLEFDCPLHVDDAAARAQGYPSRIAPYSSLLTYTVPSMWRPGERPLFADADRDGQPARSPLRNPPTGLEPATEGYFATDLELELERPLLVGDRLHRVGNKLLACVPKETRVGRGAFTTWENEIRNSGEDVVARMTISRFSYTPTNNADGPAAASPPTPEPTPAPEWHPVDWHQQRSWEEVHPGDELAPVAFPLTVYRLVVAAGANRDFNSIHHNSAYAQATGAADMYANTTFLLGMWERTVREFIGLGGGIRSISGFNMRRFNLVGDTVVVRGRVEETWRDAEAGWAGIQVWSENRDGISVGPGRIVVTLPTSTRDVPR